MCLSTVIGFYAQVFPNGRVQMAKPPVLRDLVGHKSSRAGAATMSNAPEPGALADEGRGYQAGR
jgi:hypothetical protein